MKRYQSHKIVEAGVITMHTDGLVVVDNGDGSEARVKVPEDFAARGEPSNGDYLVRYAPDGYLSWSPKSAFEAGYTLLTARETPAAVEVTVSAPAGKRAEVIHGRGEQQTAFTVAERQTQSWSVMNSERVTVRSADISTIAHKRGTD